MDIQPYKQSLTFSCLAASFLMILEKEKEIEFNEITEQEIALLGSRRIYPFYVVGITTEMVKKYGHKVKVIADNKYFANILDKSFSDQKDISVEAKPITAMFIRELVEEQPVVCHIDDHGLGDYSHASHFIVIEKGGKGSFTVVDPWTGKRKRITDKTLENAIYELKTHVKMCPLLFHLC